MSPVLPEGVRERSLINGRSLLEDRVELKEADIKRTRCKHGVIEGNWRVKEAQRNLCHWQSHLMSSEKKANFWPKLRR